MVEKQISSYYRPAARWIRWVVKGGDGKRFLLAILTLPLAALLVACATGSQGTAPPGTRIPLTGTEWMLTSLDGNSPVDGATATLAFYQDNYMEGTSGCNSFGTDYATQDGELRIAEIHRTEFDCVAPPDIMRQDRAFFEALAGIAAYRATEDRLEFDGATGKTVLAYARKRPAAVDPALRDTEWFLTQLDGRDLLPGSHIQLHLGPEGFGGFAGCNSYGGQYEAASGGILQFGEWGITAMACSSPPGVMEREQEYIDALRQAAAYRLADSRLEIQDAAGATMLIFVQQEEVEGNPADLIGTVWQLVWMDGQPPIEDSSLTLAFHDGQLASGYAGCRDYVATYEAQGGDLAFAYLGMLGPVCSEQALLEQEGNYTTVLGWTAHYQLTGDRLTLRTIRGETLTFEPVPARVQPDVEGPTWSLLSFVQPNPYEESPVPGPFPSDVLSGTQITAVFAGGTLSGSAGCNGYSTAYRRDGTSLSLEAIATTKKACVEPPGLMDQEQRYLDFLQGVTTAHVYDHELWLETGDGRALVLVARREGVPARLRITNDNPFPLDRVVVILPDERIDFGSLAAGETSDYQEARYGVYAYAAFEVAFDGQTIEQPVVDWVGEYPLPSESFTYVLSIDPKRPFMQQIQNQVRQE